MFKPSVLLLAGIAVYAATPVYITDTIRSPVNSRPYKGTVTITMSTVLTCGVDSFIKDVAPVKVTDGIIALTLMPNDACTPAGSSYSVRYEPPLGAITTETWVVPTSDVPLRISAVRSAVPATVPTAVPIALTALASGGASIYQALCWNGTAWTPGDCGGGGGAWGSITGTLSAQADLVAALNLKQASITSSTDLTARDMTVRSFTVGDGSTAGRIDACTADETACASLLAPVASGSEPTCDATARGTQSYVLGGTGVADAVKICKKAADGTFSATPIGASTISAGILGSTYGVSCDGSTANATPLQDAINAAVSANKTLYIEGGSGSCLFNTTLTIAADRVSIVGIGRPVLAYTGSAAALSIGNSGRVTYKTSVSGIAIDLSGAGSTAVGILATNVRNTVISDVEVKTGQGGSGVNGQTAIKVDGTGGFSAMTDIYSPYVHGDFTNGVLITGPDSGHPSNSTLIAGGGIFNTSVSKTGAYGVRVVYGDTTRVFGTSVEDWGTGVSVESNYNGPIAGRFEGNTTDWVVASGVLNTSLVGATFSSHTDSGTSTSFASNGSELKTQVGGDLYVPGVKATTGTRYVCVDTTGKIVSSASACSGT